MCEKVVGDLWCAERVGSSCVRVEVWCRPYGRSPASGWVMCIFFFSSRRRHTRSLRDWSSDVCSSDLFGWLASRLPRARLLPAVYAFFVVNLLAFALELEARVFFV